MLLILAFLVLVGGIYLLIKIRHNKLECNIIIAFMIMIIIVCSAPFYSIYVAINEMDAYDYEMLNEKFKENNEKIDEWAELIEDRLSDEPELVEMLKEHLETVKSNLNKEDERMLILKGREETYRRLIWPIKLK